MISIEQLYRHFLASQGISTDSRKCFPGALFFALSGEHFDGNDYAAAALDSGASHAVIDRPDLAAKDSRYLLVADTRRALQDLACYHRQQLGTPLLLITGTNGKTTTKELVHAVVATEYPTLATEGNLNNEIGLPLTLLRLKPEHRFAVIEAGASHPGDIALLAEISCPNFGLITNIGRAHLEGFGSFEGVVRTKCELYDYLGKTEGKVFLHGSDPLLSAKAAQLEQVSYYTAPMEGALWGELLHEGTGMTLDFVWHHDGETYPVHTQLVGDYNLPNAMAAIAVGLFLGVSPAHISSALTLYTPKNQRSQLIEETPRGNRLIVDAYNANPSSMQAAMQQFIRNSAQHRPRLAVLGDMYELGESSETEHRTICQLLAESPLEAFLVGKNFASLAADFVQPHLHFFPTLEQLRQYVEQHPFCHGDIWLKGSRSMHLEETLDLW